MTIASSTELETQLADMIAAGADLDEIAAAIAAASAGDAAMADDEGRPQVPDTGSERGYWNIRDRAAGDPARARDLAEWAIAKHAEAEDRLTADQEACDREMQRLQERMAKLRTRHERTISFFAGVLEQYADDYAPREKSVAMLHGTLRRRKNRTTVSWDEAAALAWAASQPEADELAPRRLAKAAVNAYLRDSGEVVEFRREVEPPTPYTFVVERS